MPSNDESEKQSPPRNIAIRHRVSVFQFRQSRRIPNTQATKHQPSPRLLLNVLVQILKQRRGPTALILLTLLARPHRLLLDLREMDLQQMG